MALPWTSFVVLSILWIVYRFYLVFQQPVDILQDILGVDVPPVPEIALSSVTKNTILVYWKPSDTSHASVKQYIQINGVNIEDLDYSDGSVTVSGLQPGSCYGIRAIIQNEAGNSTYSRLIQVQTLPEDEIRGFKQLTGLDPRVVQKTMPARRVSRPTPNTETSPILMKQESDNKDVSDAEQSIEVYNARLNSLRDMKDSLELEVKRETEEGESQKLALMELRDAAKQRLEDQDKEYQERRKQVNELEKQAKTLQRRKQMKEKLLQQKKNDRQRMHDEVERWKRESTEMAEKISLLAEQKVALQESHDKQKQEAQERIDAIMNESKLFEEEIKDLGAKVNEAKKNAKSMQDEEAKEHERRELQHENRMAQLNEDYRTVYTTYYQLEAERQQALDYRSVLMEDRMKNPGRYAMIPGVEYNSQLGPVKRSTRSGSRVGSTGYSSRPHTAGVSFNSTTNPFPSGTIAFNNRPNFPGPIAFVRNQDIDSLTGGALVSPSANQLLPKDLLGDADEDYTLGPGQTEQIHIEPINQRSGSWDQDPQSPRSMHSTSQSALNSPHASFTSIPNFYGRDTDGTSLHSTNSPRNTSLTSNVDVAGPRRRSNIFGFGRQRPKSSVNELPPFGSLSSAQSQSFPLNDNETNVRKKTGYSGWSSPVANLLNRGTTATIDDDAEPSALPKKTKRGLFGSKLDPSEAFTPYDRSSSPRPPSTNSYDVGLPRPSSESNPFGWTNNDGLRQRASPLGGDWSNTAGPSAWSRNPSRRPSAQYGSTSNLSIGSLPIEVDEYGLPTKANQPAPIGTERFSIKSRSKAVPKLNPAAPSFTARLFTKKEKPAKMETGTENDAQDPPKSKSRGKNKNKNKDKAKDKTPKIKHVQSVESDIGINSEDGSNSQSHNSPRRSRDTYSYSQDDESQGSMLEPTQSLTDPNLLTTPTSATPPTKETLIQRITRKSSSSKFSAAWKERGTLFNINKKGAGGGGSGEPSTPGDVEEEDTGSAGDYISKGSGATSAPDSATGTGTAPGTPVAGSSSANATTPGAEKERPGRLSSSWGRVMSITGKAKASKNSADKDEKERESFEGDDSSTTHPDE